MLSHMTESNDRPKISSKVPRQPKEPASDIPILTGFVVPPKAEVARSHEILKPPDRFTADEVRGGSAMLVLEAALAIKLELVPPIGYTEAADFYKTHHGSAVTCTWVLTEAEKADKISGMRSEFPDVEERAIGIMEYMERSEPVVVDGIIAMTQRMQQPNYTPDGARELQGDAIRLYKSMTPERRRSNQWIYAFIPSDVF